MKIKIFGKTAACALLMASIGSPAYGCQKMAQSLHVVRQCMPFIRRHMEPAPLILHLINKGLFDIRWAGIVAQEDTSLQQKIKNYPGIIVPTDKATLKQVKLHNAVPIAAALKDPCCKEIIDHCLDNDNLLTLLDKEQFLERVNQEWVSKGATSVQTDEQMRIYAKAHLWVWNRQLILQKMLDTAQEGINYIDACKKTNMCDADSLKELEDLESQTAQLIADLSPHQAFIVKQIETAQRKIADVRVQASFLWD